MGRLHKGIYVKENKKNIEGPLDSWIQKGSSVLDLCVDIAIEGTPLRFFDKPSVRALTRLAMKGAAEKPEELRSGKVRDGIVARAAKLRELLKLKLKGRKISLSADFGTRHGVDFLSMISAHNFDEFVN